MTKSFRGKEVHQARFIFQKLAKLAPQGNGSVKTNLSGGLLAKSSGLTLVSTSTIDHPTQFRPL